MAETKTYYVSFTLADNRSYTTRYDGLMTALRALSPHCWWAVTTSYILFESERCIDYVAGVVANQIDASVDVAIVATHGVMSMRVLGAYEDEDIFRLVPFAKKA